VKTGLAFLGACACAAALAACGGGAGTPPVVTTPATAAPTAAPTSAAIAYVGTKTVNYSYGFDFSFPAPAPGTTAPPSSQSFTVTASVTPGASPFPGPSTAGLVDEHIAESDNSTLSTSTFSTDAWETTSSTQTLLFGETQQEPSSDVSPVTTTIFGTPQILAQTSPATWTNVPTAAINYTYSDGTTGARTVAADGTYLDSETLLGGAGGQAVLTENSDASGSITGPYFGGGLIASITLSAPVPAPGASPNVTFSENFTTLAQQEGLPPSESLVVPAFYAAPPVFYTEADSVATGVTLPPSCTPNAYGTTGVAVERAITQLDTVIGDLETTQLNTYEVNGLPVCLTTTDITNYAYDEQSNTPFLFDLGSLGTEVVTTNESLILNPGVLPTASAGVVAAERSRSAASMTGARITTNPMIAALQAHQLSALARARAIRNRAFLTSVRSLKKPLTLQAIKGGLR
jgi:hypothetical protein